MRPQYYILLLLLYYYYYLPRGAWAPFGLFRVFSVYRRLSLALSVQFRLLTGNGCERTGQVSLRSRSWRCPSSLKQNTPVKFTECLTPTSADLFSLRWAGKPRDGPRGKHTGFIQDDEILNVCLLLPINTREEPFLVILHVERKCRCATQTVQEYKTTSRQWE